MFLHSFYSYTHFDYSYFCHFNRIFHWGGLIKLKLVCYLSWLLKKTAFSMIWESVLAGYVSWLVGFFLGGGGFSSCLCNTYSGISVYEHLSSWPNWWTNNDFNIKRLGWWVMLQVTKHGSWWQQQLVTNWDYQQETQLLSGVHSVHIPSWIYWFFSWISYGKNRFGLWIFQVVNNLQEEIRFINQGMW